MNGVFAVNKPGGPTSQDIVGKLKKIFSNLPDVKAEIVKNKPKRGRFKAKDTWIKIGHGGTLDPLADGVLVIGVGSGTKKLQNYLGNSTKRYTATCLFGASTTSYDSEGKILGYGPVDGLTDEKLQEVLGQFRGKITQVPPVFSALKMDGRPLYEYARLNIPLPRKIEERECTIDLLTAGKLVWDHAYKNPAEEADEKEREFAQTAAGTSFGELESKSQGPGPTVDLTFTVSSGTYIRSLINDIGHALGTQAHMVRLTRETQGDWVLGKNTIDVAVFDKNPQIWRPVLDLQLEDGPKRETDYEALEDK